MKGQTEAKAKGWARTQVGLYLFGASGAVSHWLSNAMGMCVFLLCTHPEADALAGIGMADRTLRSAQINSREPCA